jgi:Flp pilus assembly protein TadG
VLGPLRVSRVLSDETGSALPFFALAFLVLIGFLGLVIDGGNGRLHQRRLQQAVDLGLLAGAQKLPNTGAAEDAAEEVALANWNKVSDLPVEMEVSTGCRNPGCVQPDKIRVVANVDVPTYIGKLFGRDQWDIEARGSACGPCEVTTQKFDVMFVVDRSHSMCQNSSAQSYSGGPYPGGNCIDLDHAKEGVRGALTFFDPAYDRVGLAVLSSGDNVAPFNSVGTYPCDRARSPIESPTESNSFSGTWGDFMDGTSGSHDSWVLAGLASDFKNGDGSLNTSSQMVSTLDCLKHKYWTPVAPAIEAAKNELLNNPRAGARQFIILLGDGGANVQPMRRNASGGVVGPNPPGVQSWYTPTSGNNLRPCPDAIAQAQLAKDAGIEIFSIGYDLNASGANVCRRNNDFTADTAETARTTLEKIASPDTAPGERHFYDTPPGDVSGIFNAIARQITGGGTRLIE